MCVCLCVHVTPGYAAEVSERDSRLLEVCSVPGCGRRPAGSGHCSAGNSTPVFWQTSAPPKNEIRPLYEMCVWLLNHVIPFCPTKEEISSHRHDCLGK